jgi:hypothetical protein
MPWSWTFILVFKIKNDDDPTVNPALEMVQPNNGVQDHTKAPRQHARARGVPRLIENGDFYANLALIRHESRLIRDQLHA